MADTLWYSDSRTNGQPKGVAISHTLIIQSLAKIAIKMATVRMMYDIRIQVQYITVPPMNNVALYVINRFDESPT
jgi:hypothetical protein